MSPQPADALPTDTYYGGSKTVEVGGRKAQLNHVYNAHTDGDTWIYFDDANVLDTGDTFTNTGRYNTIDFTNGGDIRGLVRAVDAYLKVSNDQTKIVPGHGALGNRANPIAWREMLVTSRDRVRNCSTRGRASNRYLLQSRWPISTRSGRRTSSRRKTGSAWSTTLSSGHDDGALAKKLPAPPAIAGGAAWCLRSGSRTPSSHRRGQRL